MTFLVWAHIINKYRYIERILSNNYIINANFLVYMKVDAIQLVEDLTLNINYAIGLNLDSNSLMAHNVTCNIKEV